MSLAGQKMRPSHNAAAPAVRSPGGLGHLALLKVWGVFLGLSGLPGCGVNFSYSMFFAVTVLVLGDTASRQVCPMLYQETPFLLTQ